MGGVYSNFSDHPRSLIQADQYFFPLGKTGNSLVGGTPPPPPFGKTPKLFPVFSCEGFPYLKSFKKENNYRPQNFMDQIVFSTKSFSSQFFLRNFLTINLSAQILFSDRHYVFKSVLTGNSHPKIFYQKLFTRFYYTKKDF